MATTVSLKDIENAYAATLPAGDPKAQVRGQPHHPGFYPLRKIIWIFYQTLAIAGDATSQGIIGSIPYSAVANLTGLPISVMYNSETFTWAPGQIYCMRENEAEFVIQKARENSEILTMSTLTAFFAGGTTNFFYW